jgi:hypothetical protein
MKIPWIVERVDKGTMVGLGLEEGTKKVVISLLPSEAIQLAISVLDAVDKALIQRTYDKGKPGKDQLGKKRS